MADSQILEDTIDRMKAEIFRLADVLEELNLELKQRIEAIEALEMVGASESQIDIDALPAQAVGRGTNRVIMQNDLGHPIGCGCVECKKARKREWYHKNKERIKEQKRLRAPAAESGTKKKPEIIGLNRELHLRDESVNQFVTALTGFAQEAERCTGDPVRLSALREAARAAISEMSREAH